MTTIDTVTVNAAEFFHLEILGYADNDLRVFALFRDDVGTFAVEDWCMDLEIPADRIGQHDVSDLYAKWWNDSAFADDTELEAVKRELGLISPTTTAARAFELYDIGRMKIDGVEWVLMQDGEGNADAVVAEDYDEEVDLDLDYSDWCAGVRSGSERVMRAMMLAFGIDVLEVVDGRVHANEN
jgi:hypothetical protein